jgi:hypothetical protein
MPMTTIKNKDAFKPKVASTFKKKSKEKCVYFVCNGYDHWVKKCKMCKDKQKKVANEYCSC